MAATVAVLAGFYRDREQRVFLRAVVMHLLRTACCLKIALVGLEDAGHGDAPALPGVAKP